jgi:5-(carboxyamino)imidazole ribonucleotide synthase
MLNLIGSVPDPISILGLPDTRLHLYGKSPAPRRKLGHVTILSDSPGTLKKNLDALGAIVSSMPPAASAS